MSRKAPLYDPNMINEDLRVRGLSMLAQLLFAKLCALANSGGGFIKIGAAFVSPEKAAAACAFDGACETYVAELVEMGLLVDGDEGWYIPELKQAQELRDKRSRAGATGGQVTTARRKDVSSNVVCLSKAKKQIKSIGYNSSLKKEKRTKKEKNNKYIYISDQKIFTGDRGEGENHKVFIGDRFTVFRREMDALQLEFPGFGEEKLWELLENHNEFMNQNEGISNDNWHIPLVGGLRKLHAGMGR